ncbi:MAG: polysaccharide deacetylase family protein [Clostridium sp.]|uniref:polysaccharide deacetylase family protein n=1 Tax=Clostridium sp. TaxID=1506 RepID=UPI002909E3D9|nr:polysaccharide deacetylase family protein [Clostridium sp.]MDU4938763.1 polysaccharide deacetylase family protein [Clostridium sp.]
MDKYRRTRLSKKRNSKKMKVVLVVCFTLILLMIPTFIYIDYRLKGENQIVSAQPEQEEDNTEKEPEKPKLDNSGYLTLEEDENADSAQMVSENTNGLLTGTKTYPVRTDGKKVAYLTFDDGPSTTNTPEVLKVLDKYNVKGTFFVLGTSLKDNTQAQEILKTIAGSGHAIANHTYSHDYKYLYPNRVMNVENITNDIEKNNALLKEILGKDFDTKTIRFPGGYWSWKGRQPMKDKMIEKGYCNIDWNALNGDAEGKKKDATGLFEKLKSSVEELGPNADSVVILMHDTYGKEETVKALPQIIEYLQGKGFEFRTMK